MEERFDIMINDNGKKINEILLPQRASIGNVSRLKKINQQADKTKSFDKSMKIEDNKG